MVLVDRGEREGQGHGLALPLERDVHRAHLRVAEQVTALRRGPVEVVVPHAQVEQVGESRIAGDEQRHLPADPGPDDRHGEPGVPGPPGLPVARALDEEALPDAVQPDERGMGTIEIRAEGRVTGHERASSGVEQVEEVDIQERIAQADGACLQVRPEAKVLAGARGRSARGVPLRRALRAARAWRGR